jgi:Zn-dependent protease
MKRGVVGLLKLDLLATLLITSVTHPALIWCLAVATVLHEAGHAGMARALGLSPRLRISLRGVRVLAQPRTAHEGFLIALAGPGMSLLTGDIFLGAHLVTLGIVSLCAGACMLIPIRPLDGYLAWRFARVRTQPTT